LSAGSARLDAEQDTMNEFDVSAEVNVRTYRFFVDGDRNLMLTAHRDAIGPELQELLIGGRSVPLEAFYRIPREAIGATVLGWVNLPWDEGGEELGGAALHVVWQNEDGKARRALVPTDPPPGADPEVWADGHARLKALPHLFVGT
jgi:hypothetical protein